MYLNFITNQLNSSQTTVISIQCPVESILSYFIKKLTEAASAGHPFMTSAKFQTFLTPPSMPHSTAVHFGSIPSPPPTWNPH
jgi:hypothetical protein